MRAGSFLFFIVTALCWIAGGCVQTTYSGFEEGERARKLTDRRVQFVIDREFYVSPPDCVTIFSSSDHDNADIRGAAEDAVERHLATKFNRFISARSARSLAARLGLNLGARDDRRLFGRMKGCDAFAKIDLEKINDSFAIIWAERSVRMSLELTRSENGKLLWKAHHDASRSDGGLPLSFLSLPISVIRAARLNGDEEIFHSILDDALRRMMATLPNTRGVTINARR
ncbi:MAG: hypothetical protein VYA17_10265 [Pseudomonadota bacterium]|nr:hypothetical protein [Pseudomonadota bacterium]